MMDEIEAHRELNTHINNYFSIEFVAIPPDFDISNFLSLREQAGIFKFEEVDLDQVRKIAEGVKYSPVFAVMNNALLSASSCMYFLSVLNDLGLILKSIHNPMRMNGNDYKHFIETYEAPNRSLHIRGQRVKTLNFIIVNIFPMMSQNVIDEAFEIAQNLQKYQSEVDQKIDSLGSLE